MVPGMIQKQTKIPTKIKLSDKINVLIMVYR